MFKKITILLFCSAIWLWAVPIVYPMNVTVEAESKTVEPMNVTVYPIVENQEEIPSSNEPVNREVDSNEKKEDSVSIKALGIPFLLSILGLLFIRREQ